MKTAIILHGMPSKEEYYNHDSEAQSNKHWLPWIQRKLILASVLAQTPEMPHPYRPVYEDWKKMFERFDIDENTILIGHSCGAGFLVRWLSENKVSPSKVLLVAPWMDPEPHRLDTGFFDFTVDPSVQERTKISVFFSEDDDEDQHKTLALITKAWPKTIVHRFKDRGHFTEGDMGTKEFPELAAEVI